MYWLIQNDVISSLRCGLWHTHTHPFNGPLSGTTRVSRYQKGKTNLDFTEARDSEWQWYQLGHMQVCTSLQTDNHASTPPLKFFYRPDALPCCGLWINHIMFDCCIQCKSRWETCESRLTEARNEYLLNLASTNSHLLRYYNTNLPELLTVRRVA